MPTFLKYKIYFQVQTKKVLAILLIVLFVAAVAAPAISAYQTHHSDNGLQLFYTERAA